MTLWTIGRRKIVPVRHQRSAYVSIVIGLTLDLEVSSTTALETVVSRTTLFLRSRVRLSVELAQFSGVLDSCRYSVGHPSGISSALSASLMESAASEVTQVAHRSSLLFSHHRAVSFMPAFRFSRRHLPTSL